MLPLITAPAYVLNNAGSGILSIAFTPFDAGANEFIFVSVSYEVAAPTITCDHNGPYAGFNSLTLQHDAGDIKGHQEFWIQTNAPRNGLTITARFSTGVGFAAIYVERRRALGTVSLTAQGTPGSASASSTVTVPAVTGSKLHIASIKAFGSFVFQSTNTVPFPYGTSDNSSRSHHVLSSNTPFSGTLTPATATLSGPQNWLCTSASFADSGSPVSTTYIPRWYANAAGQTVVAIPGTTLVQAGASVSNGTTLNTADIFASWSGGAVAQVGYYVGTEFQNGPGLVVWGEGHTVGGTARYAYGPLLSEYPGWVRLRDNQSPIPENVNFDGSGTPVSIHTYSNGLNDRTSGRNRMLSVGGRARFSDSGNHEVPYAYDLNQVSPNINNPYSNTGANVGSFWWTAWDEGTALVWGQGGATETTQVKSYDPVTGTVSTYTKTMPATGQPILVAVDQTLGIIFHINGGSTFTFVRASTLSGAGDFYTPSTTGTAPSGVSAVLWDSVDKRFVCYVGTNTLYFLTPPSTSPYQGGNSWAWSNVTFPGAATDSPQGAGTYGRFAFVNEGLMRGYLLVNSQTSAAYMFIPKSAILGSKSLSRRENGANPKPLLRQRAMGLQ